MARGMQRSRQFLTRWDVVFRLEVAPVIVAPRTVDRVVVNREEVAESQAALKDFNKRSKKTASLITQTIDDSLVMSLDVFDRDPYRMWEKLARDFNTVTASQSHIARREFLSFKIRDDEGHLEAKHRYEELLRRVKVQGGEIEDDDKMLTLLGALLAKFDMLKEAFHARENQPGVEFIWDRMYSIDATEKLRAEQSEAFGMMGEVYYQRRGGLRGGPRGRGRGRG